MISISELESYVIEQYAQKMSAVISAYDGVTSRAVAGTLIKAYEGSTVHVEKGAVCLAYEGSTVYAEQGAIVIACGGALLLHKNC